MLALSIFIAWSLVRIGGVCCAGSVSTIPRRTVNRRSSRKEGMRGGAVRTLDRADGHEGAVHDRWRAARGAGGRPPPHRNPAASPGAATLRVRRGISRRLLPDGGLPGLLGPARGW